MFSRLDNPKVYNLLLCRILIFCVILGMFKKFLLEYINHSFLNVLWTITILLLVNKSWMHAHFMYLWVLFLTLENNVLTERILSYPIQHFLIILKMCGFSCYLIFHSSTNRCFVLSLDSTNFSVWSIDGVERDKHLQTSD